MSSGFSKEEQAIYDRQIRVWGFNAQLKLKNSIIGIIGTTGLSIELLKNLVLAGVGGVLIIDDELVEEEKLGSNFYINASDLGKKRAEVCADKLRLLNPKVEISIADSVNLEEISKLSLLCCTDKDMKTLEEYNELCRSSGVGFVSGNTYGLLGFIFLDLNLHKYIIEKQDKTEEHETKYVSLKDALKISFSTGSKKQLQRKLSSQFIFNISFLVFNTKFKRMPTLSPEDLQSFRNIIIEQIKKFFPAEPKRQEELVVSYLPPLILNTTIPMAQTELAPCTAIVGGIMAQEVLKALSCKDSPINNFFVYNGLEGDGLVHCLSS